MARPICFRLLMHWARRAASRAAWTAGSSRAIRTAMMAMTTRSSISVKARRAWDRIMIGSRSRETFEAGRSATVRRIRLDRPGGSRRVAWTVRVGILISQAPVAQLDRVADFESEGCRFDSYRAHYNSSNSRDFAPPCRELCPLFETDDLGRSTL